MIDLGLGHPAGDLLPQEIMRRAAALHLGQGEASLLQYGEQQGDARFRLALASFLTRRHALPVGLDDLFVTCGASMGLDLICTLYTRPGDLVFVEEPSYFLALDILADHGLEVVSVPTDVDGLVVDALEGELRRRRPALLYTIPTHQNPSSATLPLARRQRLIQLSQEHGFLIVADEAYDLLSYEGATPPSLASLAAGGTVLSVGSFSKILAPGLRLGWVQAAPQHIKRLARCGLVTSGGGLNPLISGLVGVALEQGWQDEQLDHLKAVYRTRMAALSKALQRELGDLVTYVEPAGGYFFWLQLPSGMDATELMTVAAAHKVGFRPGARFSSRGGLRNHLRLSVSHHDGDTLAEGVRRLRQAILAMH
ncbi:MAG: putative aminotransferase [Deltaproteobacteria bacterium]|nr:putative aminotransferase [Deltaproteobacteria bacterium]